MNAAHRNRQISPARPRSIRRGRAADRAGHRHRAHARGVRDDRARARPAHRDVPREAARIARSASSPRAGKGFGIVAGTGTGKTLAIRPIAEDDPRHDDSSRSASSIASAKRRPRRRPGTSSSSRPASRAAGSRTATSFRTDTLVVDEIHQTSAELELCLALGKRVGCRFIWLSATVDPTFYARVSRMPRTCSRVSAFDPAKAARREDRAQGRR